MWAVRLRTVVGGAGLSKRDICRHPGAFAPPPLAPLASPDAARSGQLSVTAAASSIIPAVRAAKGAPSPAASQRDERSHASDKPGLRGGLIATREHLVPPPPPPVHRGRDRPLRARARRAMSRRASAAGASMQRPPGIEQHDFAKGRGPPGLASSKAATRALAHSEPARAHRP